MNPLVAGTLVFVTSGAVLIVEILAGRLLAPYVGVSLETYTGVIGTVLAGISVGTWVGGYVADRVQPRKTLGPLLIAGGALCAASVPLVRVTGRWAAIDGAGGSAEVLWLSLAAFFAPAAVLSAVTPTVVKLQLRDLHATGRVVGRLSALATAGAIVGTFLAGFVLVERVPTTTSIIAIGAGLIVAGALLAIWLARATAGVVATVATLALAATGLGLAADDPCHVETVYHCARVDRDPARPGGRLLVLDNLRHSYVDLDDPTHLEFRYAKLFADVLAAALPPETAPLHVVHIGGGGFTLPRYLRAVRPGSTSVVLEIDPGVVDVARTRLGLVTGPDLRVEIGDARQRLASTASYDLAVGDAFGGLAVPWHLTTVEFVRAIHAALRPGGLYLINVIDDPPFRFARAEVAAMLAVFDDVVVIPPPGGNVGGNIVVAARRDGTIDRGAVRARLAARASSEPVLDGPAFAGDAPVLRDDYAPVDQWLARDRQSA